MISVQPIGQQALGTIRLRLMIEDMMTYVTFHVIDAITSTNLLLGRPWLGCTSTKWCPLHGISVLSKRLPKEKPRGSFQIPSLSRRQKHSMQIQNSFYFEPTKELRKPAPIPPDQMAFSDKLNKNIEAGRRLTMKKTYRYIPSEQRQESDPIFNIRSLSRRGSMAKTQDLSKCGHTS